MKKISISKKTITLLSIIMAFIMVFVFTTPTIVLAEESTAKTGTLQSTSNGNCYSTAVVDAYANDSGKPIAAINMSAEFEYLGTGILSTQLYAVKIICKINPAADYGTHKFRVDKAKISVGVGSNHTGKSITSINAGQNSGTLSFGGKS